jgi:hypothetical protein
MYTYRGATTSDSASLGGKGGAASDCSSALVSLSVSSSLGGTPDSA